MEKQHFHSSYEFYYLFRGQRLYFIENQTYLIREGTLVFINRNCIHKTMPASSCSHERILLNIEPRSFERQDFIINTSPLLSQKLRIIQLEHKERYHTEQLLFDIIKELQHKEPYYCEQVLLRLMELVILILRKEDLSQKKSFHNDTDKQKIIFNIIQYLSGNLSEQNSLDELSRMFYLSKYYLCRSFKEITGLTVREYINLLRIRKARELLESDRFNITEISQLAGYSSITHFERIFKEYTGTSPRLYRTNFK